MSEIDRILQLVVPGRLCLFVTYPYLHLAEARALKCIVRYPQWDFSVGEWNGEWGVAVIKHV